MCGAELFYMLVGAWLAIVLFVLPAAMLATYIDESS